MEAEQVNEVMKENVKEPTTTYFDPNGDRRILVGPEEYPEVLVVSSQAMSLTSRQWRAMVADGSPWVKHPIPSSPKNALEISLPDDNAESLKILLSIIHLKFKLVPTTLPYHDLVSLAILCDKYDVAEVVQPWIATWIQESVRRCKIKGTLSTNEGWLFVAWTFGDTRLFKLIFNSLIQNIARLEGNVVMVKARVLDPEHMPPGVLDSIVRARDNLIKKMLKTCYDFVDRYAKADENETICEQESGGRQCDAIVYGSLLRSLQRYKLWPMCDSPSIEKSATELATLMRSLEIFTYSDHGEHNLEFNHRRRCSITDHTSCSVSQKLEDSLKQLMKLEPSPILEAHKRHLEIQEEKCLYDRESY